MKRFLLFFLLSALLSTGLKAQDIQFFTLRDYDLKGSVQTCEVRTDYGKEVFTFDREGRLTRAETIFSEDNKNITVYEFTEGELTGKRIENISSGEVDRAQSFRYTYHTSFVNDNMKISEDIVSYDKNFSEKHIFEYDSLGTLLSITQSNQKGLDEIRFERRNEGDTLVVEQWLNRELLKVVKTFTAERGGKHFRHEYTIEIFQGEPYEANERIYNNKGMLTGLRKSYYDEDTERFREEEYHAYRYDENGILKGEEIRKGAAIAEKGYVFQYDDHEPPNWIRKIETPSNTYVSRVITYYDSLDEGER